MSRNSLLLSFLLGLPTTALADGQLDGVVFHAGHGGPWSEASIALSSDDGGQIPTTKTEGGSFSIALPAGTWTLTGIGPTGEELGRWTVRIEDGAVSEALLTLDPTGEASQADISEPPAAVAVVPAAEATFPTRGQVVDEEGEPVVGATIVVRGQSGQVQTDAQGAFEVMAAAGDNAINVMADGFRARTIEFAVDESGESNLTSIEMRPAGLALDDFTISAPRIEGGTSELIQERQNLASVSDVLGAEQMSRSGDSDAASALKRVTGLTVVDGKYVYVRGLGERYSASLLNGATLPSPEPERRVVPLDLFPTKMLESVVIQKTFSPDQPAEFGGGVVSLRTKTVPDKLVAKIDISTTYINGSTFESGLWGFEGSKDWLGFGEAPRAMPASVRSASSNSPLEESDRFSDSGYEPEELEAFGEAMPNHWGVSSKSLPLDLGISAVFGHGVTLGEWKLGGMVSGLWDQDWSKDTFERNYFLLGDDNALEESHTYRFSSMGREVRLGGAGIFGIEYGDHHTVQSTTLLNRSSEGTTRRYEGANRDVDTDIRVDRIRWIERQLLVQQFTGDHVLPFLGDLGLEWTYTYSEADRTEPDRREFRYDFEGTNGLWYLSDRPEGNGIFFSELGDVNTDLSLGARYPITMPWMAPGDGNVKVGWGTIRRDRGVDTRRFKYMHKGERSNDGEILSGSPDEIFVAENIGVDGFQFEETTLETDNYAALQNINSLYFMTNLELHNRFRVMGGYRLEESEQRVETFELFNPDMEPVVAALKTADWLPAATGTLGLGRAAQEEELLLRFAYGKTLSRPDFRELSPATFNDVTGGRQVFGNPDLQRTLIDNYDLRAEWYPAPGESISVGGFFKAFEDPIEKIVVVSAQHSVTYQNAESARNTGVEFEFRKALGFAHPWLEDVFLSGNAAWIKSRVELADNAGVQSSDERPLEGQSPYVINAGLSFEPAEGKVGATLLYNVVGKRITEVGALGAPDYVEMPRHRLDAAGFAKLGAGFKLGLKGRNLLNSASVVKVGNEVVEKKKSGWSVSASLGWSL